MQIEIIFVFGHLDINKETIQLLAEYNIIVKFFTFNGKYIGEFSPSVNKIGSICLKQLRLMDDDNKKIQLAKEIIVSSTHNILEILKYYYRKGRTIINEIQKIEILKQSLEKNNIETITGILLIEAKIKNIYYNTFNKIIINKNFIFNGRSVQPPLDEINALMSYGYSILYGIIDSIIHRSNLLNNIPIIHGTSRKDSKLSFDIADIFKPILIDRIIFRIINKKQLSKEHFIIKDNGYFLNKIGATIYIQEIEKKLCSTYSYNNKSKSFRSILGLEIHNLEKSIAGLTKYKGFKEHI